MQDKLDVILAVIGNLGMIRKTWDGTLIEKDPFNKNIVIFYSLRVNNYGVWITPGVFELHIITAIRKFQYKNDTVEPVISNLNDLENSLLYRGSSNRKYKILFK